MLAAIRQLGKHSMIYGLGSLLTRLIGVVLLPIYTRYLTPADYGIVSLLVVTANIAGIVTQLGLGSALFREVIYQGSDESTVESTALYFLLGESTLFFVALIAFSYQLASLIFGTIEYAHLLRLTFISGLLGVFDLVLMAKLRTQERSALYATLSVARFLVGAMLNVYFIVVLHRGVEGLVTATLLQAALFAVVCLALLIRDLRPQFSIPILRRMLSFGVPLVPFGIANFVMTSAGHYFLQHFSTTAEVGLYSLGYKFGMVVSLIVWSVQLAWPAQMFAIAKQPDAERQLSRMLTYYLVVLGFIGLGLSALAREALVITTTPGFYRACIVVPLIALSYILYGAMYMTNTALETQNKTKYMFPVIVGAAVLNLALSYLLIPPYGMIGAAWVAIISYLFWTVVNTAVNLHFWYIPYEYKRIARIALAWGLIYGGSLLIRTPNVWLSGGLKLVLLAAYPLLLYVLRFYRKSELAALKRLCRSGEHHVRASGIEV